MNSFYDILGKISSLNYFNINLSNSSITGRPVIHCRKNIDGLLNVSFDLSYNDILWSYEPIKNIELIFSECDKMLSDSDFLSLSYDNNKIFVCDYLIYDNSVCYIDDFVFELFFKQNYSDSYIFIKDFCEIIINFFESNILITKLIYVYDKNPMNYKSIKDKMMELVHE